MQAHAQKALQDASSLWVLEATAVMQQSADKGQTAHGSDPIPRSCMARKCGHDEGGQRQDVSGRKALQHSSPASQTALLTFCTGTLGYFRCTH
jgi:hypothetical protein